MKINKDIFLVCEFVWKTFNFNQASSLIIARSWAVLLKRSSSKSKLWLCPKYFISSYNLKKVLLNFNCVPPFIFCKFLILCSFDLHFVFIIEKKILTFLIAQGSLVEKLLSCVCTLVPIWCFCLVLKCRQFSQYYPRSISLQDRSVQLRHSTSVLGWSTFCSILFLDMVWLLIRFFQI